MRPPASTKIEVGPYLSKLCASLAASMIGESQPITLKVIADRGAIGSDKAVSIGLIVTELVINAIKYAFPADKADARVLVTYESQLADWKLIVSDNGVGKNADEAPAAVGGLGRVAANRRSIRCRQASASCPSHTIAIP
jgi:two-component sensor histidine kinase